MNKYIICNLKAYQNLAEIKEYKNQILPLAQKEQKLIIAPSYPYIYLFSEDDISLASQDISIFENGPYTGQVTAEQLASLKVNYSFISHYELKNTYENKELKISIEKIENALQHNIIPIYFFEKTNQIKELYEYFGDQIKKIIFAYEPDYSIGATTIEDPTKITEIVTKLKQEYNVKVLYGGSISIKDVHILKNIDNLDGIVLGRSSLNAETVKQIYQIYY